MRKKLFLACLVTIFFIPAAVYAQSFGKQYYVGLGASYSFEDIKWGDVDNAFDNTFGVNGKLGYHAHDLLDIEFVVNWVGESDASGGYLVGGRPLTYDAELKAMTYMFALKGFFPMSTEYTKLSVIAGGGIMHAKGKLNVQYAGRLASASVSETDLCAKVGMGLDHYVTPEISIGMEGNYTWGFSDLSDIRYWQLSMGVAYHF